MEFSLFDATSRGGWWSVLYVNHVEQQQQRRSSCIASCHQCSSSPGGGNSGGDTIFLAPRLIFTRVRQWVSINISARVSHHIIFRWRLFSERKRASNLTSKRLFRGGRERAPYVQLGVFTTHDSPDSVSQTFQSRGSLFLFVVGFTAHLPVRGGDFEVIEYLHEGGLGAREPNSGSFLNIGAKVLRLFKI